MIFQSVFKKIRLFFDFFRVRDGKIMILFVFKRSYIVGELVRFAADHGQVQHSFVKELDVPLIETLGMDAAQVTAGGILTAEFDMMTMESLLVDGLYACGEVLDIDGDCGGYNLQWAWSSGWLAGCCAGEVAE